MRQAAPVALAAAAAIDHAQLAKIAVERTPMPMVVSDPQQPDNPIVLANRAFLDQTGYDADAVIGRNCRFLQGPNTDLAAVAQIRAAIAGETELTIELLNYRRDGSTFWNRLLLSPITDDDGNVIYFFASQLDVSAERRARDLDAHERVLLREIDHRAKNALALVQGIVRLSRTDDVESYSRTVQGRVEALAQAHIVLSDAQWRAVPLDCIVAAAAAPFGPGRIASTGSSIAVAVDQVQPLMLALHELLTNAEQHGGLSAARGRATVRWHDDGEAIVFELSENGGPPPDAGAPAGYGLKLVDAFIRRQLGGTVERRWDRGGLWTRATFPRSAVAADPAARTPTG